MEGQRLVWSTEIGEATWIAARLAPFGTTVSSVVPGGFAAYARLLHPAQAPQRGPGRLVRWAEVAAWSGLPLRRDAQFHSIAMPPQRPQAPAPWRGQGPRHGSLHGADATVLAQLLRDFTATPGRCFFCVWDGYGWEGRVLVRQGEPPMPLPDPLPDGVRRGARVKLPQRHYLLLAGPLEAVADSTRLLAAEQMPNLWWPADRAWFVASEIDLAWTYVGAPTALVERLLADRRLEGLEAGPDDRLSRVESWLERLLEAAADRLLASEQATVTTSRGTVFARLERPTAARTCVLRITHVGEDGVAGHGSVRLAASDEDGLRRAIVAWLTARVIDLVGG